jgi:hypothetical protein
MTDVPEPPSAAAEPDPPGETVHIHKPKPARSVREFLSEISVIVCGVLIALALEQTVEMLSWAAKAREARSALHKEMAMAQVFAEEREARKDCADSYLADLAAKIVASPPRWRPPVADYCGVHHPSVYSAPDRPWPTEVWKSVETEGTVSHFEGDYRRRAPFLFDFIKSMADQNEAEVNLAAELNALSYPIIVTPDARIGFLRTIERLRRDNASLALESVQMRAQITALGEAPTEAELAAMRAGTPYLNGRSSGFEATAGPKK